MDAHYLIQDFMKIKFQKDINHIKEINVRYTGNQNNKDENYEKPKIRNY